MGWEGRGNKRLVAAVAQRGVCATLGRDARHASVSPPSSSDGFGPEQAPCFPRGCRLCYSLTSTSLLRLAPSWRQELCQHFCAKVRGEISRLG